MWLCLALFSLPLFSEEVRVETTDPVYKDGILSTKKGGVVTIGNLRIQGREIEITEEHGEKVLHAKGDLLVVKDKKFLVGDAFSYNFVTKTGVFENGISSVDKYFVGGKTINFTETGALQINDAFATTSDNKEFPWAVTAKEMRLNENFRIDAKEITPKVGNTPFFFLPAYSMALQKDPKKVESPIQYLASWEKGQGLVTLRSRLLDWNGWKMHWRGEYRITRGAGTAIEVDYKPKEKSLYSFSSHNFYAYDTFARNPDTWYKVQFNPNQQKSRYRLQGAFAAATNSNQWEVSGKWDALSDGKVRSDFPRVFEGRSFGRTEGFIKGKFDTLFTSLYTRPRINSFQGFKQELPTLTVVMKPYTIPFVGTLFENSAKVAYLDHVYTDKVTLPGFASGRMESSHILSHPFHLGPVYLAPKVGYRGIYYTSGPKAQDHFQALLHYDLSTFAEFEKSYGSLSHEVRPYIEFQGVATPTAAQENNFYIFSVQDGHRTLNQLKLGMRNSLFTLSAFSPTPRFSADLYTYHFYRTKTLTTAFPKAFLDLAWNYPNLSFQTNFAWNLEKGVYDHANLGISWTLNEYFATALELQNRGKYEWRKNRFTNYVLDMAYPIDELAKTPLSDERTALALRWQLQLAPLWSLQVTNHLGFRPGRPFYHESSVNLYTTLINTWKLGLSYARSGEANEYSFSLDLL